jgi:hypothetical protein
MRVIDFSSRRSSLCTLHAGHEPLRPRPAEDVEGHDATLLAVVVANDCGPPRWTDVSVRSAPTVGGPLYCQSKTHPGDPSVSASRAGGPAARRRRIEAGGSADDSRPPSGSPMLGGDADRELLAALLTTTRQYGTTPACRHPRPESVFANSPLVPRAICGQHRSSNKGRKASNSRAQRSRLTFPHPTSTIAFPWCHHLTSSCNAAAIRQRCVDSDP